MQPSGTACSLVIHGFVAFGPEEYAGGHDASVEGSPSEAIEA